MLVSAVVPVIMSRRWFVKKLRKSDRDNFNTLLRAAKNGDLALVSSRRTRDGSDVALVCAVQMVNGKGEVVPLAEMVSVNPYDVYEDPTL